MKVLGSALASSSVLFKTNLLFKFVDKERGEYDLGNNYTDKELNLNEFVIIENQVSFFSSFLNSASI